MRPDDAQRLAEQWLERGLDLVSAGRLAYRKRDLEWAEIWLRWASVAIAAGGLELTEEEP